MVISPPKLNIQADTLNMQDEKPTVTCGPHMETRDDVIDPFYVTLNIQEHMLHKCMLDSRASHNFMLKVIMEKLGLDITMPYHYLYSFDAK